MALAVASTTTAIGSSTTTLTINKPSGVTAGDLLLIIPFNSTSTPYYPAVTGFTQCAFVGNAATGINALYRIADSTDVAASNYTISSGFGGFSFGLAVMMRITGWSTGNPVLAFYTNTGDQDATTFTPQVTSINQQRGGQNMLITAVGFLSKTGALSTATISGYTVTSSDANPTWTEVIDTDTPVTSGLEKASLGVAYATTTATSNITGFSCDGATDISGGADWYAALFIVLQEPTNVTSTVSHNSVTPSISGITASQINVAPTVSHNAIPPTLNGLETLATIPTQWTPVDKS